MRRIERNNTGMMSPGQDLVVAGYAGLAGTVRIARIKRQELRSWFSEDYVKQILEEEPQAFAGSLKQWEKYGAREWEPSGEGGILKTLWDLSGAYETGIEFTLSLIPIKQETIEVCERYDLNPYRLLSIGCLLFTADNGGDLVKALHEKGVNAAVVGKVTKGISRVMVHGKDKGFLERPTADEFYKVINKGIRLE